MVAQKTIDALVFELGHTKKYASLFPAVLVRIAVWALDRYPEKTAGKEAKRKLHQVFGSYINGNTQLGKPGTDVLSSLDLHASTHERLTYYSQIFPAIWAVTGQPNSILDVACGLNPLARVQMGLSSECDVSGFEIDRRLVKLINDTMEVNHWRGHCSWGDALSIQPDTRYDVALVLKTLPCMEQQQKGGALQLLHSINAAHIVVSYPTKSLGGRDKGMLGNYRQQFQKLMLQCDGQVTELVFPNELFYVITSVVQ